MATSTNLILELEANLFELSFSINKKTRKEVMEELCIRLGTLLQAENVSCYMYNKWHVQSQISAYFSHHAEEVFRESPQRTFEELYNRDANQQQISEQKLYIKLYANERSKGLVFISMDHNRMVDDSVLQEIRICLERFIAMLYDNRYYRFLRNRSNRLFELSTELHSVHETTEVLKKVLLTMQELYPFFSYRLLMSQDYECEDLPLKLIEYSGEGAMELATLAFIHNKLKLEYITETNEVHIYAPLSGTQSVYGVIHIIIPQLLDETEIEVDLIEKFANMAGRAVERTTLFQSSNQQLSDLQIINDASHALNMNLEQNDIMSIIKKFILDASHADEVGFVKLSEEHNPKNAYTIMDGTTDYFLKEKGQSFIQSFYEELMKQPNAILSGNFTVKHPESIYNSIMVIPMWSADVIFGFIVVAHPVPYYFSFDKFKLIKSFIQHASLAFKNSVLKEQLRTMATTDYLTKLYSRNYLDKMIAEHMDADVSGVFVLFDVDDFKIINDTYGHYIGDKVLIQVAEIIQQELSSNAIAARWGGEEFAIYFPKEDIHDVMQYIDHIRQNVKASTQPQISLSSGVSYWNKLYPQDSIEQLFIQADEALYEAKTTGKNKIVQKHPTMMN